MKEREYSPRFLSDQMESFKFLLETSPTGKEVLEILNQENARGMHKVGGGPYMDGIKLLFPEELKADFERLSQSPYVDCLKDAVYIIDLDLRLVRRDYDARIEYTALFEHTDGGVAFRMLETPISVPVIRAFFPCLCMLKFMPRGGKRSGAGRKAAASGK